MRRKTPVADRLWAKVNKTETCWLWTGATNPQGYGRIYDGKLPTGSARMLLTHRVTWALANGEAGGLCVLHRCDTPLCVRPDHLFLGTKQENSTDMMRKGRHNSPGGEASPVAKLTKEQAAEIRAARARGEYGTTLAVQYGVSPAAIYAISQGRSYRMRPSVEAARKVTR